MRTLGWRDMALTAMAPSAWGTTYIVATELLPPGRPLLAATLRALPVGLLLLLWVRRRPAGAWWWRSCVLGALNIGLFNGLLFCAAYRLPGGVAATLAATFPLLVALLSWPLLGKRPAALSLASGAIGLCEVALLVLRPEARLDAVGICVALGAALSMALGIVLTKLWGSPSGFLAHTTWQLVAGGVGLSPFLLALEGVPARLDSRALWGFAYLGLVGTGLAYAMWFRGIGRLPATRVATLGLLSPMVAVGVGAAFAGERLGAAQAVGFALVLSGVIIGQRAHSG